MFWKGKKKASSQGAAPVVPAAAELTQTAETEAGAADVDHDAPTARPGEIQTAARAEPTQVLAKGGTVYLARRESPAELARRKEIRAKLDQSPEIRELLAMATAREPVAPGTRRADVGFRLVKESTR